MSYLDHFATYQCAACGATFKATEGSHLVGLDLWCSDCHRNPPRLDQAGLRAGIVAAAGTVRPWLALVPDTHRRVLESALDKAAEWQPGDNVVWAYEPHQRKAIDAAEALAAACVPGGYIAQAVDSVVAAAMLGAYAADAQAAGIASQMTANVRDGHRNLALLPGYLAVARVLHEGVPAVRVAAADLDGRCRHYRLDPNAALEFAYQLAVDLGVPRPRKLRRVDHRLVVPLLAWISSGREP